MPLHQVSGQLSLSEAAMHHLLGSSGAAVDTGLAWAGASHWHYRTRAAARPANAALDTGTEQPEPPAKAPSRHV